MTGSDLSDVGFLLSYLDFLSRRGATQELRRKASLLLAVLSYLSSTPAGAGYEASVLKGVRRAAEQARSESGGEAFHTLFGGNGGTSLLDEALRALERGLR